MLDSTRYINNAPSLIEAKELRKAYSRSGRLLYNRRNASPFNTLDGVSLSVQTGETSRLSARAAAARPLSRHILVRLIEPDSSEVCLKAKTWCE